MKAIKYSSGEMVEYTPGTAVSAGDVIVQGGLVGVALQAIPANTVGSLAVAGVFDFVKATGSGTAITAGASVYWDASNQVATTTSSGNTLIGKAVKAASISDDRVRVRMSM
jgi:predicted RecA/RadA family phage recombinase